VRHEKMAIVILRIRQSSPFLLFAMIVLLSSPLPVFGSKKSDAEKAGAVLFRDKGCAFCHGLGGVGGKKAPALTGLPKDKTWTQEKMTEQILNGGKKMPPFRESLTDDEVSQLIAYLRTSRKPVPPPSASQSDAPAPPPGQ
jgi:mono/diheme cytochrome c family protein